MPTFKEQQSALTRNQHKLAIWEFLYSHLDDNYVSKDGRVVEKALRVPDCLVPIVTEESIEDVLKFIQTYCIDEYRERILNIENQELGLDDEQAEKNDSQD